MPTPVTSTYTSNTSVVGQINDAFSTVAGVTVAASSVAAALGNKSALAGLSKAGAAIGMTGAILDAGASIFGISGVNTKFSDSFASGARKALAAVSDYTPEQVAGKRYAPPGSFTYPSDLGNFYIQFTFSSYVKDGPLTPRKELPEVVITLPIPSNLQESFNIQYNSKSLGPLGRLANSDVVTADRINKILTDKGAEGDQAVKDLGKGVGDVFTDPTAINALLRMGAGGLSDTLGAAVERVSGAVLNPYAALQFEGVSLRQHSFNFKFSPNSYDDSLRLAQIIREFKIRMHPENRGLLYNFPDKCNIVFGDAVDMPYKLKPCFLESMAVNYAPSGTPSFFKQGLGPTDVELSLTFGEIEPITREFYSGEKVSENTSKPSPQTVEASKTSKAVDLRDAVTGGI